MVVKSYVNLREHEHMRDHEGEPMWVLINHIRPEKRKAFEHFLGAVLMPATERTPILKSSAKRASSTHPCRTRMAPTPILPDGSAG